MSFSGFIPSQQLIFLGIDQYIVEVHNYINVQHVSKDIVHEELKGSWCIGEVEGHDVKFVVLISGSERGLMSVGYSYSYLPIAAREIDLAESFGSL